MLTDKVYTASYSPSKVITPITLPFSTPHSRKKRGEIQLLWVFQKTINDVNLRKEIKQTKSSYVRISRHCTGLHCLWATRLSLTSSPECYQKLDTHTFYLVSVTLGILWYVLSFHSGKEDHWNVGDQPEHRRQSQSDLPIPESCRTQL